MRQGGRCYYEASESVHAGGWDRMRRCYSKESESVQVGGTGWAGATARSQSLPRLVGQGGQVQGKESDSTQVSQTGWAVAK